MLGETILLHIAESTAFHVFRHSYSRLRFLHYSVVRPHDEIRVSFSALLALREGAEYLLVRNLHRKESFGPFGGVIKRKNDSSEVLNALEFRPQEIDKDMRGDLRGFLPRKNIGRLLAWYRRNADREKYHECLRRELLEELREAGLKLSIPDILVFRPVRTIKEGPYRVDGEGYLQYRIFEIYELDTSHEHLQLFERAMIDTARSHTRALTAKKKSQATLLFATPEEIRRGRSKSGLLIGHHAGYLFGSKRIRPELPMFNTGVEVREER